MSQDRKSRFNLDEDAAPEAAAEEHAHEGHAAADDADYASPERFEQDKVRLVDFLQYPREKRKMTDFLEETYKAYEQEAVERLVNRVVHEHEVDQRGATDYYKPGHIGPLMYEYLNMSGVEASFVSGLQHTKSSMTKTVQQRVDEINTLLRGVGGFNRQIKASFSRSAVVYLEQEDPYNKNREKVVFTVNIGDFELRYPLDESAEQKKVADGRTLRRLIWDEAVNTLAEIVSNTGLKPKYVKNDKNQCVLTMRQYLLSPSDKTPDEFFTFDLRHMNDNARKALVTEYVQTCAKFEADIAKCKKQLRALFMGRAKRRAIEEQCSMLEKERDFYVGTTPDPRHMDNGLVFSIAVNTLKDYTLTKDKMQVIMTKYILALSKIAVDKSLDQQVNTVYQRAQKKPKDFQSMDVNGEVAEDVDADEGDGSKVVVMKDDLLKRRGGRAAG